VDIQIIVCRFHTATFYNVYSIVVVVVEMMMMMMMMMMSTIRLNFGWLLTERIRIAARLWFRIREVLGLSVSQDIRYSE
jgi:hypothetical protein